APAEALVLTLLEPLQLAALFLGRPALALIGGGRRDSVGFREPLAGCTACGRFVVKEQGVFGRAAALGQGADRDEPVVGTDANAERIADLELLGRLGARPVDLDFAAA